MGTKLKYHLSSTNGRPDWGY